MKKKVGLYIVVLILLGFTAYTLVQKAKKSTLDQDSSAFAYNDTAAITKITILEKNGDHVSLERQPGKPWMVNGAFEARIANVNLLLYTLKQVQVKYPISENGMKSVIQTISTIGKRIEFYKGDKKVKVWYMGGTSTDNRGTNMILGDNESDDKYETGYITYIPGFEGYLNSRFFTEPNNWKSLTLVSTTPPEIDFIKVEHTGLPDSSFIIKVNGVNNFTLTDLNNQPVNNPDTLAIKQYLSYSCFLSVNDFLTGQSGREIDSVKQTKPFTTITIKLKNGHEETMKLFSKKPSVDEVEQELGVKLVKDPNYAYILFKNDQEFGVVAYLQFGKLIQSRSYFLHPAFVKK